MGAPLVAGARGSGRCRHGPAACGMLGRLDAVRWAHVNAPETGWRNRRKPPRGRQVCPCTPWPLVR